MLKNFIEKTSRVGRATTKNPGVVVILAYVIGLSSVGCGSSNQDHTHSGEEIDSGRVSEARIDASIARDNEMPFVRADRARFDGAPNDTTATTNTVRITAPVNGFLAITSSMSVSVLEIPTSERFCYMVWLEIDDKQIQGNAQWRSCIPAGTDNGYEANRYVALNLTEPVSAGSHKVTLMARNEGGFGGWGYDSNNLTVIFFPDDGRSGVT